MEQLKIRFVEAQDIDTLLAIYAPYVEQSAVSFEYTTPTHSEFQQRIDKITKDYPFLVAEQQNEIIAYAYYQSFHERTAYQYCAEISIYVKSNRRQKGIGRQLYEKLEAIAVMQNICHLYACIAYPRQEDKYLNTNSYLFHQHMGYQEVGRFPNCGYKFTHWYDVIWMDKELMKPCFTAAFLSIHQLINENHSILNL